MGLQSEIQAALGDAFDADLADAVSVIGFSYTSTAAYDTSTGITTNTETTVQSRGLVEPVSNDMIDGEVVIASDTSFTILSNEISITPKISDKITVDGIDYSINIALIDPAKVAWNLIGRVV